MLTAKVKIRNRSQNTENNLSQLPLLLLSRALSSISNHRSKRFLSLSLGHARPFGAGAAILRERIVDRFLPLTGLLLGVEIQLDAPVRRLDLDYIQ